MFSKTSNYEYLYSENVDSEFLVCQPHNKVDFTFEL